MATQQLPEDLRLPNYTQTPRTLAIGDFLPDIPSYLNPGITVARNCVPVTPVSYGPLPSLVPYTGNKSINPIPPLPAEPFGLYSFLDRNNNERIFTGTATNLYQFEVGQSQFADVSAFTTHYAVSSFQTLDAGTGYTAGNLLTLIWSPSGTAAQILVGSVGPPLYHVAGAAIVAAGASYLVNDVVTIVGGTFTTAAQITVNSVNGSGAITSGTITTQGNYSVQPTGTVTTSGGHGTGATFTLTFITDSTSQQILTATLAAPGDHTVIPPNPVQSIGGSGSGASFNIQTTISGTDGAPYTSTPYDPWCMVGFGNAVIATNGNDAPQVLNIDTDTAFSALNQYNAPFGKYVATVKNFLVMANVFEPQDNTNYPWRIHWSAVGDASNWPTLGSNAAAEVLSDAQDLRSDLGHITGIGANLQSADMVVLLELGVYIGIYSGSPAIFSLQIAQGAVGCNTPRSVVTNRGFIYYLGLDGWYSFDGTTPTGIGANKIDHWFFNDPNDGVDPNYLYLTQGSADPTGRLIMWAYCGPGSGGVPNRLLCYNWLIQRWSVARINVGWLGRSLSTGYSLAQLNEFNSELENITPSLDDPYWQGGKPYLLAFDDAFNACSFSGPNLAATIETTEQQLTPNMRSRVTSARPLVDGGVPSVAMGYRNRLEDAVTYSTPAALNIWGNCPQRSDARFFRAQITMPAGAIWSNFLGVDVDYGPGTYR